MKTHWTEQSVKDYLFKIVADLFAQLEDKMESERITKDKFAEKLGITKGRVSQILNHPGNITLGNVVKLSKALGMKVSLVAYEDDDLSNTRGPINSEIFRICWQKLGKPQDFWDLRETVESTKTISETNTIFMCITNYSSDWQTGGLILSNFPTLLSAKEASTPPEIQKQGKVRIHLNS